MIYLIGGSGSPNYGDELIIKFWLDFISSKCPNTAILAESNIPTTSIKFHNQHKNVAFLNSILKIAKNVESLSFWEQVRRGKTFFDRNGKDLYDKYDLYFSLFNNVDLLHIHGGGYMRSSSKNSGFLLGIASALKEKYKIKIFATGLGMMPLSSPPPELSTVAQQVIQSFDIFECRDSESFKVIKSFCQSAKIISGLDDNFLADKKSLKWNNNPYQNTKNLHLSFSKYTLSKFSNNFWQSLTKYSQNFERILFWESNPFKDRDVINSLSQKIDNLEVIKVKDLVYKGAPAKEGDCTISGRFHPHFVASRLGTYGYFYSFDEYYNIKHSSVLKCGSSFENLSDKTVLEDKKVGLSNIFKHDHILHQKKRMVADQIYSNL